MYGIILNSTLVLSYASGSRKFYTAADDSIINGINRFIWSKTDEYVDPYMVVDIETAQERSSYLQKQMLSNVSVFEFTEQDLENLVVRKLKAY